MFEITGNGENQLATNPNDANMSACDGVDWCAPTYSFGSKISGGSPMPSSSNSTGATSGGYNGATIPAGTGNMTMAGQQVTLTFSPL
jgi:hypothetical protein